MRIDMPQVDVNGINIEYRFERQGGRTLHHLRHRIANDLTMWDGQVGWKGLPQLLFDLRGHSAHAVRRKATTAWSCWCAT